MPSPVDFDTVYAEHHASVLAHAVRLVGADDGPDLAQQVWLRVFSALEGFRGEAAVGSWLYTVTRHLAFDRSRLAQRQPWGYQEPLSRAESLTAPDPSPEDLAVRNAQRALMDTGIRRLPVEQQAALLWSMTGETGPVGAAALGVCTDTFKTRKWRGAVALKAWVSQYWTSQPFVRKSADSVRAS